MPKRRCFWAESNDLLRTYHDEEWGVPIRDDRRLFEALSLEGAQAGLSWLTVLKRRDHYRRAFLNFEIDAVAALRARDQARLLKDEGLIRHAGKIQSVITNARAVRRLTREGGSFTEFVWRFEDGQSLSRELRRRDFKFVGPTICQAFLQAVGVVNGHVPDCFRWPRVRRERP